MSRKTGSKVASSSNGIDGLSSSGGSTTRRVGGDDYGSLRRGETAKKPPPSGGATTSSSNSNSSAGESNGHLPNTKRLSSSSSSPSLARLVATSGLDIYEKYSPANYKPNCELSRSRSGLAEPDVENGGTQDAHATTTTATVTLDRPRSSRYSRLYSSGSDSGTTGERDASSGRLGSGKFTLSSSSSSGDVPTATFTLRSNRTRRNAEDTTTTPAASAPPPPPPPPPPATTSNGHKSAESNGLEAKLNGLSLLSSSPKRNAIYESRSGSSLRNLDTTDDSGVGPAGASKAEESNGDVTATATFKLGDGGSKVERQAAPLNPESQKPRLPKTNHFA